MKNTFTSSFLGLAISGLLLASCSQMASYENEDLALEQARADKGGFTLSPYGSITGNLNAALYEEGVCETQCIDPANPVYFEKPATILNNSGSQTRVFTYSVYNTLSGFELDWEYAASNSAGRKLRITVSGAGFSAPQTYTSEMVQSNGSGSHPFIFDASWAACEVVTINAEILNDNDEVVTPAETTTYGLIGECTAGCEESFTHDKGNETEGTITFTYTPSESAKDALLTFTFAQSAVVSMEDFTPDGATMKSTMDLVACETYTFVANIESLRCTGVGQENVNVWTDFTVKIGEGEKVSKKNEDTPKIIWACTPDPI